jgi:hypothetical protein
MAIKWNAKTSTLTMDLFNLEHCDFSHDEFDGELHLNGIDDPKARWPETLVVRFKDGSVILCKKEDVISRLEGKIVKILDDYRVIINIGENTHIRKDMKFFVYELGEEITDPDTGKSLGKLENVKHRFRVDHVGNTFSVLTTDEYQKSQLHEREDLYSSFEPKPFDKNKIKVEDLIKQDID